MPRRRPRSRCCAQQAGPYEDRLSGRRSRLQLSSRCPHARRAGGRSARDLVRIAGPEPDLQMAFAKTQEDDTQALVALENPIIGVHAAQVAERALSQNLPALLALEQAGAGGLLSYGTSLGQAAHRMAWQASRLLEGDAATALPIEPLRCPDLSWT